MDTQGKPGPLLAPWQEGWETCGRHGVSPAELMAATWAKGSDDKSEFYHLQAVPGDDGAPAHHYTVVPFLDGTDAAGRPRVIGLAVDLLVETQLDGSAEVRFDYQPIGDVPE